MYKVFVNEKLLSIQSEKNPEGKNLVYEDGHTLEIAFDQLNNTSQNAVTVYGPKPEKIWDAMNALLTPIEAAGGLVLNKENKILFIYRLDKWDLPKGKMEKGEAKRETAVREVEEECSIQPLQVMETLSSTYHIYQDKKKGPVLKSTYWYMMKYDGDEIPQPQTEEGITQVAWMDWKEIDEKVLPNTFENIKLVIWEAKKLLCP